MTIPALYLGPPVVPIYPFLLGGSLTKIDDRRKGSLILSSLLEDLDIVEKYHLHLKFTVPRKRIAYRNLTAIGLDL